MKMLPCGGDWPPSYRGSRRGESGFGFGVRRYRGAGRSGPSSRNPQSVIPAKAGIPFFRLRSDKTKRRFSVGNPLRALRGSA